MLMLENVATMIAANLLGCPILTKIETIVRLMVTSDADVENYRALVTIVRLMVTTVAEVE